MIWHFLRILTVQYCSQTVFGKLWSLFWLLHSIVPSRYQHTHDSEPILECRRNDGEILSSLVSQSHTRSSQITFCTRLIPFPWIQGPLSSNHSSWTEFRLSPFSASLPQQTSQYLTGKVKKVRVSNGLTTWPAALTSETDESTHRRSNEADDTFYTRLNKIALHAGNAEPDLIILGTCRK